MDTLQHARGRTLQRLTHTILCMAALLASTGAAASAGTGVPWVDYVGISPFGEREELTRAQVADKQFRKGRQYYEQAREFESKAAAAATPARERRLLERAFSRYKASADMFQASLKRIEQEDTQVDYLPQLYLEMGDALYKTRQHAEAADTYRAATEVAPAFLNAHFGLARARLALGDLAGVRAGYEYLLREADTRGEAWARLDTLIELIVDWQAGEAGNGGDPSDARTGFDAWFAQAREELSDTVRWTALESP
ncbi:MAG: hypothetical protein AAFU65_02790 [Pseudomonadota bacterium]